MLAPIILPRVLPDAELTEELDAFFEGIGVRRRLRSTYAVMLYVLGLNLGEGRMGASLIDVFRNAGLDSTKHVTYGAFNEGRARAQRARTLIERSGIRARLAAHQPLFVPIEVERSGEHATVKACLALRDGLMPYALASTSHRDEPVDELVEELRLLGLDLPLVTLNANELSLNWVLRAATKRHFDHFAIANPLWRPPTSSGIRLVWSDPAGVDSLGLADSLANASTDTVQVTVVAGAHRVKYMACGPTRKGRYYLQRVLPPGLERTREVLAGRIRAVEQCEMSLAGWPVEHLGMRPTAHCAWERMQHAIVMASAFQLHVGNEPRHCEDREGWARTFETWDVPQYNVNRSVL